MRKNLLMAITLCLAMIFTACASYVIPQEAYDSSVDVSDKMSKDNWIYIPGSNISCELKSTEFTKKAIDENDIIYSTEPIGENNPFVIGHNYNSLGDLPDVKEGQYIYLSINGKREIYKVFLSEEGKATWGKAIDSKTGEVVEGYNDIIGVHTGTSINYIRDTKVLHIYTCYGLFNDDARWIVLAELVN